MGQSYGFRKYWLAIAGALAACHAATAPAQPANLAPNGKTWSENAVADLREVRSLIEANTPGPVDPLNPGYRRWLEIGFVQAMDMARKASGEDSYIGALRFYTNGFRDDHLGVNSTVEDYTMKWPLFVTGMDDDGKQRVRFADEDSPVPVGAELVGCDGKDADALLHDRVLRYRWNADIPHR